MKFLELNKLIVNCRLFGVLAIVICALAWFSELAGVVYICPYCRVQRTVIGLLGFLLILPFVYNWVIKYIALVIGFFGAVVASSQHFMGWKKISAGEFAFNKNIFIDPFLLSGFALFAIIGLTFLVLEAKQIEQKK